MFGFTAPDLPGWTGFVLLLILFGSVQLLLLGVLGEYVGRIYEETKGRPRWVIEAAHGFESRPECRSPGRSGAWLSLPRSPYGRDHRCPDWWALEERSSARISIVSPSLTSAARRPEARRIVLASGSPTRHEAPQPEQGNEADPPVANRRPPHTASPANSAASVLRVAPQVAAAPVVRGDERLGAGTLTNRRPPGRRCATAALSKQPRVPHVLDHIEQEHASTSRPSAGAPASTS